VSEGTRTPDRLDHNQELYQLSYAHRETAESTSVACPRGSGASLNAAGPIVLSKSRGLGVSRQ